MRVDKAQPRPRVTGPHKTKIKKSVFPLAKRKRETHLLESVTDAGALGGFFFEIEVLKPQSDVGVHV